MGAVLIQPGRIAGPRFSRGRGMPLESLASLKSFSGGLPADNIKGNDPTTFFLGWENDKLPKGTNVFLGYGLGIQLEAGGTFQFLFYPWDGIYYLWGSEIITPTPEMGQGKTDSIASYAPPAIEQPVTWDAYCFIATGSLGILTADYGHGRRTIGLKQDDFGNLSFIAGAFCKAAFTQIP